MISHAEWEAHLKESADRARRFESRDRSLEDAIRELTQQIASQRITIEQFASRDALLRASAQMAQNPVIDGSITHQNLHALSASDAATAVQSISFWKARPAVVVGFVGAALALAIGFGLPITTQQFGLFMAFSAATLAFLADMRGQRTTTALVRAGERRGALAGPDSFRPGPIKKE